MENRKLKKERDNKGNKKHELKGRCSLFSINFRHISGIGAKKIMFPPKYFRRTFVMIE